MTRFALIGSGVVVVGVGGFGLATLRSQRGGTGVTMVDHEPQIPREQWTMPPLALLERPRWSTGRKAAMLTMRGYLVLSVILLIVKAVQLGGA